MAKHYPCFLVRRNIVLVYIYPFGERWDNYAKRFADHYKTFMPATNHRLIVVSNGGKPTQDMQNVFSRIDCEWFTHNNSGYDIGAYQSVAKQVKCEIMVMFSASTYLRKEGWLERMVEAHDEQGIGIYGAMGNTGQHQIGVWPHVRTTAWWLIPEILNEYPFKVSHANMRYMFEHGRVCICEWAKAVGINRWVVGFDRTYRLEESGNAVNGFHRGDQSNLLCGDRLTESPYYPHP